MDVKKVVVVGATGNLGSKIVKSLIEQRAEVTAMVRATSNRTNLEKLGVRNFVVGDMMDKELFGDLPTVEEAVKRYCSDFKFI